MNEFIYPVEVIHLLVSTGHNYFGQDRDGDPGNHRTDDCDSIELRAGEGIVGDRFFGKGKAFDGHVTFFAAEAWEKGDYLALRRNIVVRGIPVTALIGHEFEIFPEGQRKQAVRFRGTKHCAPCVWLDKILGEGTMAALRGRGGLRAQVLTSGQLYRGVSCLASPVELDPACAGEPLARPSLP